MKYQKIREKHKNLLVVTLLMCFIISSFFVNANIIKADVLQTQYGANSADNAQSIKFGDTIEGSITEDNKENYYIIHVPNSGKLDLTITSYMKLYSVNVINASGDVIWYTDDNQYNSTVGFRTDSYKIDLIAGYYYICVTGYRWKDGTGGYKENSSTGNYKFKFDYKSANETFEEDNNTALTASNLILGKETIGQIASNDKTDYYKCSIDDIKKLKINMTSYMEYYSIVIFDKDGKTVWDTYGNTYNKEVGYCSDTHIINLDKGIYYIRITGQQYSYTENNYLSTGNYKFTVTAHSIPNKVKLNYSTLNFYGYGDKKQLKASFLPSDATSSITWESNNTLVASVNKNGLITTKDYGSAIITAKTENGITASVTVNVNKLKKPESFKVVKYGKTGAKLTWKKVTKANGYLIYRANSKQELEYGYKTLIKTITKPSTTSFTNTKLKKKTTYYYQVVPYRLVNGEKQYGNVSTTKKITIK